MSQGNYAAAFGQFYPLISDRLGDHCGGANRLNERETDTQVTTAELERALKQDPTRVDLRCELGRRYMSQGNYAAAYSHYSYLIRDKLGPYCRS